MRKKKKVEKNVAQFPKRDIKQFQRSFHRWICTWRHQRRVHFFKWNYTLYALIIRALQVHEYSTTFIDKKKFEIVRHQLKMRKKTRQKVKITLISVLSLQKKKDQHQIISSSKSTPIRCNFSSIADQVFIRINLVFEIGLGIIITRM